MPIGAARRPLRCAISPLFGSTPRILARTLSIVNGSTWLPTLIYEMTYSHIHAEQALPRNKEDA